MFQKGLLGVKRPSGLFFALLFYEAAEENGLMWRDSEHVHCLPANHFLPLTINECTGTRRSAGRMHARQCKTIDCSNNGALDLGQIQAVAAGCSTRSSRAETAFCLSVLKRTIPYLVSHQKWVPRIPDVVPFAFLWSAIVVCCKESERMWQASRTSQGKSGLLNGQGHVNVSATII